MIATLTSLFGVLGLVLAVAIGAGKLMSNQLYGVKPWDPIMLALAALMLGLAALLASAIPARRAAGVGQWCSAVNFPCYPSCYFPAHSLLRFQATGHLLQYLSGNSRDQVR